MRMRVPLGNGVLSAVVCGDDLHYPWAHELYSMRTKVSVAAGPIVLGAQARLAQIRGDLIVTRPYEIVPGWATLVAIHVSVGALAAFHSCCVCLF